MFFKQLLIVKETLQNESRVALTPQAVGLLTHKGMRVLIETNAGLNAGFTDTEYLAKGAEHFSLISSGFPADTLIIRLLRPSKERELLENNLFKKNTAMLGFLFPFVADNHITTWQTLGLTTLSFDLFKSLSIDDPKNAQAAMSRIAGRLALHDAIQHYQGEKSIQLIIIGTGAAATSAASEALKHNFPVKMFGRNEHHRARLEAMGITYYVASELDQQIALIQQHLAAATIVLTAARTPGEKAPLLLDHTSLKFLPSHAVVVDLAISNGGNVTGSRHDQVINLDHGVKIINVSGYPKLEPRPSSEAYAHCVVNLLNEIISPQGEMQFANALVQELWVTHNGQRHESLYAQFNDKNQNSSTAQLRT